MLFLNIVIWNLFATCYLIIEYGNLIFSPIFCIKICPLNKLTYVQNPENNVKEWLKDYYRRDAGYPIRFHWYLGQHGFKRRRGQQKRDIPFHRAPAVQGHGKADSP